MFFKKEFLFVNTFHSYKKIIVLINLGLSNQFYIAENIPEI